MEKSYSIHETREFVNDCFIMIMARFLWKDADLSVFNGWTTDKFHLIYFEDTSVLLELTKKPRTLSAKVLEICQFFLEVAQ